VDFITERLAGAFPLLCAEETPFLFCHPEPRSGVIAKHSLRGGISARDAMGFYAGENPHL